MSRSRAGVRAVAFLAIIATNPLHAQDRIGTVTFSVEVTGRHYIPTSEGGHRTIDKRRVFKGTAQLKLAGNGFAQPPIGYDRASFEREKDACEAANSDEDAIAACQDEVQKRQNAAELSALNRNNPVLAAMNGARTEVWATASCSGDLEIADAGTVRSRVAGEGQSGGLRDVPYSMRAKLVVASNSPGADGCSFNLVFDPSAQTAEINIDSGPPRVQVVETTGPVATQTNVNPLDWSAIRAFEKRGLKVTSAKNGHSGVWIESSGEPLAMQSAPRVQGETVTTSTRITWQFTER